MMADLYVLLPGIGIALVPPWPILPEFACHWREAEYRWENAANPGDPYWDSYFASADVL